MPALKPNTSDAIDYLITERINTSVMLSTLTVEFILPPYPNKSMMLKFMGQVILWNILTNIPDEFEIVYTIPHGQRLRKAVLVYFVAR